MRVDKFKEMLKGVPKDFEIEVYDSDRGEWVQNFGGSGWIRFVKELPAEEL